MAEIKYIPGTNIPFMGSKHYGATKATAAAGRYARTAGLRGAQNELNKMIGGGVAKVFGLKTVQAGMADAVVRLAWAVERGTGDAVAYLYYDMDKTPPLIPVGKTGNLRESWFSRPVRELNGKNFKIGTIAGFGGGDCDYAIYVHEMTDEAYGKKIKWSRPNSGPKFLEKGLQRNQDKILEIIIKTVRAAMK